MKFEILFLIIAISAIYISHGQLTKYEFEFLDENVFVPCEDDPDNYVNRMFDISNLNLSKTIDGSLLLEGYLILAQVEKGPLRLTMETFKKVRGTWQPTVYNIMRKDFCAAFFDKMEIWHSYLKGTPKEQQTCPFISGQIIDFKVAESTSFSIPSSSEEGEYVAHTHLYSEDDHHMCCNIFMRVFKV